MSVLIDIDKSVKRKRVVYNGDFAFIFDLLLTYLVAICLIATATFFLIKPPNNNYLSFFYIVIAVVNIWTIANTILMNAMVKIDITKADTAKSDIEEAFGAFCCNLYISDKIENLIRKTKSSKSFSLGRTITIIKTDDCFYINIVTLIRGDGLSPFHGLYNYLKCRRLRGHFSYLQI